MEGISAATLCDMNNYQETVNFDPLLSPKQIGQRDIISPVDTMTMTALPSNILKHILQDNANLSMGKTEKFEKDISSMEKDDFRVADDSAVRTWEENREGGELEGWKTPTDFAITLSPVATSDCQQVCEALDFVNLMVRFSSQPKKLGEKSLQRNTKKEPQRSLIAAKMSTTATTTVVRESRILEEAIFIVPSLAGRMCKADCECWVCIQDDELPALGI